MGARIKPHEIYFGSFFELFNLRFGPPQTEGVTVWQSHGGIAEIAALQKQFGIFREDRSFFESAALLGLTGLITSPAKDRWIYYLQKLPEMESDQTNVSGDRRIVSALMENLAQDHPSPCFMRAYDGRTKPPGLVTVEGGAPLFYLESVSFLVISLPMRPDPPPPR